MYTPDEEDYQTLRDVAKVVREVGIKIENPRNDVDDLEHLACALEHSVETLRTIIRTTRDT